MESKGCGAPAVTVEKPLTRQSLVDAPGGVPLAAWMPAGSRRESSYALREVERRRVTRLDGSSPGVVGLSTFVDRSISRACRDAISSLTTISLRRRALSNQGW